MRESARESWLRRAKRLDFARGSRAFADAHETCKLHDKRTRLANDKTENRVVMRSIETLTEMLAYFTESV